MAISSDTTMLGVLRQHFDTRVRESEPLSRHGTFGVGGPADAWVPLESEDDVLVLVRLARAHDWPLMIVGNGTNVLYADAGARGIVARMVLNTWRLETVDDDHTLLIAGAGVSLPKLVNELAKEALAGLEWGAGVPGTVGGAVVSNAGAGDACVADTLKSARVLFSDGEPVIRELSAAELGLSYRHSRFRAARRVIFADDGLPIAAPRARIEPPEMIVGASFLLRRDDLAAVQGRVRGHLDYQKRTQPVEKSAGSVFKNPPGDYSGRLIEAAGLRGTRHGNAQISPKHANFIVNNGGATAADVVALIALARRTVRERFGVELELEVEPRGDW